jgi:hypothetical protein
MPMVFTACPVTGQPIDTGIEIDDVSFVRLPSFVGRVFCPHCKSEHEWTKDKAWVADGPPRPPGFGGPRE